MSDDLNKRLNEISQIFIRNGQAKFLETHNIENIINAKRSISLMSRYTDFCNEFGIKQDKKTSLLLMKFDIKTRFTWTTLLHACLYELPAINILKVTFYCQIMKRF